MERKTMKITIEFEDRVVSVQSPAGVHLTEVWNGLIFPALTALGFGDKAIANYILGDADADIWLGV